MGDLCQNSEYTTFLKLLGDLLNIFDSIAFYASSTHNPHIHTQGCPSGLKTGSAEWGMWGISWYVIITGGFGPRTCPLTFRARQKNYQCHGTGGTGQMGALVHTTFIFPKYLFFTFTCVSQKCTCSSTTFIKLIIINNIALKKTIQYFLLINQTFHFHQQCCILVVTFTESSRRHKIVS